MYRSIWLFQFPKSTTRVGRTKPLNQRYPCPKCNLARRKLLASHWWNFERWLADAFGQPLALESKRLQAASVVSSKGKVEVMKSYQIYDKIQAMEQTGEKYREEYNPSKLPSSFMSPETPGNQHFGGTTPSIEAVPSYSSCFLTPPCSQEKALRPTPLHAIDLQGLPKLDLELEDGDREKSVRKGLHRSPLLTEDRIIGRLIGEEKIDFISDLKSINCQNICQKICSFLDPQDLCRYVDCVVYTGAYTGFPVVCDQRSNLNA